MASAALFADPFHPVHGTTMPRLLALILLAAALTAVDQPRLVIALKPDKNPEAMAAERGELSRLLAAVLGRPVEVIVPTSAAVIDPDSNSSRTISRRVWPSCAEPPDTGDSSGKIFTTTVLRNSPAGSSKGRLTYSARRWRPGSRRLRTRQQGG